MDKDKYHHGSLKNALIEKGLVLLNSGGAEAFSIRKVADMCGVSHAAPYRHFKNKAELIEAITMSVSKEFMEAVEKALAQNEGDYRKQIEILGCVYVKFMVENPEHFKFIFLTNHNNPIILYNGTFIQEQRWPVNLFKKLFTGYLESAGRGGADWSAQALVFWSLVHGLSVMLINNTVSPEGNYLDLVSAILQKNLGLMDNT